VNHVTATHPTSTQPHPILLIMNHQHRTQTRPPAFTLIELLVVIAVIAILAGLLLPSLAKAKGSGQGAKCMSNIKQLTTAMLSYGGDFDDKVVYGSIARGSSMTYGYSMLGWDDFLADYYGPRLTEAQKHTQFLPSMVFKSDGFLACPADKVRMFDSGLGQAIFGPPWFAQKRTYSIAMHNMGIWTIGGRAPQAGDWPPSANSQTGVGLGWHSGIGVTTMTAGNWTGSNVEGALIPPQQAYRMPTIPDPVGTIFMTELVGRGNRAGEAFGQGWTEIPQVSTMYQTTAVADTGPTNQYHNGIFTFSFMDGHAERTQPFRTLGTGTNPSQQTGGWTVRPGD
jgi:prepilin-type N-terminal cleavage/methylation domain-containing protein